MKIKLLKRVRTYGKKKIKGICNLASELLSLLIQSDPVFAGLRNYFPTNPDPASIQIQIRATRYR